MELLKVENEPHLYRDKKSKAIISDNENGLIAYRKARDAALDQRKEIDAIKSDINDIKNILKEIMNRL